jgi:hypothetical protein
MNDLPSASGRSYGDVRIDFESAVSAHEWLRAEVARFLYPDLSFADAYAGSLAHLESALADVDKLSKEQFAAGTLIGFELRLETRGEVRKALFPRLPTPAALLLVCCDLAKPGDSVVVRHYIAHRDLVEMKTQWPFSMNAAVALVSPDATSLLPEVRSRRRRSWFARRMGRGDASAR